MTDVFSLNDVLSIAKIHPFYAAEVRRPPDAGTIQSILASAASMPAPELWHLPLLTRKNLYQTVERLTEDTSPDNCYRLSSYLSITGGGSGSQPMLFATDARENRVQRARMGAFLKICGVVGSGDWVLTSHVAGSFYRSLDLTTEILENAGASVLSAGNHMTPDEVTGALAHFHVNVLSGDGSQVIRVVHHISTLPASQREQIKLDKIIYTSEPLSPAQRAYIIATLGKVKICSMLGSSEAGPWAIANPDLTGDHEPGTMDFVFDTRTMLIEVLASSALDDMDAVRGSEPVPDGAPGIIVQTSLQRLRNPLVRYVSGDIGSLHPLHGAAAAVVPRDELEHLRVLRLHGRDARFSFKWYGSYFEFDKIMPFMQSEEWGILQWQVVLGCLESSPQTTLEVRIFRSSASDAAVSETALAVALEAFFFVLPENRHLFRVAFLGDLAGFERSSTGGKIMRFLDKSH